MNKTNKISAKSLSKNKKNLKVNVQSQLNKINEQKVQQRVQIRPQLSKQVIRQQSSYKINIQSSLSAFKPFSNALQYSNKLSQQYSNPTTQSNHPSIAQQPQSSIIHSLHDPTSRLFHYLRKQCPHPLIFHPEQLALAKCFNQPLWPCRILQIKNVPELSQEIYHIKFINDNNFSYVNQCHLVKFNEKNVQELRKIIDNDKIKDKLQENNHYQQSRLKMAEKLKEKQEKINMNSKHNKQQDEYVLQTQVYSLSSQQPNNNKQRNNNNNNNLHVHLQYKTHPQRFLHSITPPSQHNLPQTKKQNYLHYHYFSSNNNQPQNSSNSSQFSQILQQNQQNHPTKKHQQQKQNQQQSISTTSFKPIILFQDKRIQINLLSLKEMNKKIDGESGKKENKQIKKQEKSNNVINDQKNNIISQKYKQKRVKIKHKPQSLSLSINNNNNNNASSSKKVQNQHKNKIKQQQPQLSLDKPHNKSTKKPINLIIQTPKLHKNYYLNKIILKFQQAQSSHTQSSSLFSQQRMDETRIQQAKQINKVITLNKKTNHEINKKQKMEKLIKLMKQYYQEVKEKKFLENNEEKEKEIGKRLENLKFINNRNTKSNNVIMYKKIIKWYNLISKGYQNVKTSSIFSNKKCQQSISKLKKFIYKQQQHQQSEDKIKKCKTISITRNKKQKQSLLKFLQDQNNNQSRIQLSLSLSNSTNSLNHYNIQNNNLTNNHNHNKQKNKFLF